MTYSHIKTLSVMSVQKNCSTWVFKITKGLVYVQQILSEFEVMVKVNMQKRNLSIDLKKKATLIIRNVEYDENVLSLPHIKSLTKLVSKQNGSFQLFAFELITILL